MIGIAFQGLYSGVMNQGKAFTAGKNGDRKPGRTIHSARKPHGRFTGRTDEAFGTEQFAQLLNPDFKTLPFRSSMPVTYGWGRFPDSPYDQQQDQQEGNQPEQPAERETGIRIRFGRRNLIRGGGRRFRRRNYGIRRRSGLGRQSGRRGFILRCRGRLGFGWFRIRRRFFRRRRRCVRHGRRRRCLLSAVSSVPWSSIESEPAKSFKIDFCPCVSGAAGYGRSSVFVRFGQIAFHVAGRKSGHPAENGHGRGKIGAVSFF